MDRDFHYYATYVAAVTAGFDSDKARTIATSAQFIDDCTEQATYKKAKIPTPGNTWEPYKYEVAMGNNETKTFVPMVTSVYGMASWVPSSNNDETRQIWMPFHFLPGNYPKQKSNLVELRAPEVISSLQPGPKLKLDPEENIYLLCRPNSDAAQNMINYCVKQYKEMQDEHNKLSEQEKKKSNYENLALMLIGCAMHVFADTYAHQDFSGTFSKNLNGVKNKVNDNPGQFTNFGKWNGIKWQPQTDTMKDINWPQTAAASGDPLTTFPPDLGLDLNSLGHGLMGHLPDVSTICFEYQPNWSTTPITRNNPQQYMNAFLDMVKAMQCIRNGSNFDWFKDDSEREQLANGHNQTIQEVKQLICPDNKTFIDRKIYESGLQVEGSEWFLRSESRWSKALSRICNNPQIDDVPGYEEAKTGWVNNALAKQKAGQIARSDFIGLPFIQWNLAAKLLFTCNYKFLRLKAKGLARILRRYSLSKSMDVRKVMNDDYGVFFKDNTASKQFSDAVSHVQSSDQLDNLILISPQELSLNVPDVQYEAVFLSESGFYLSYVENSTLPAAVHRKLGYVPLVKQSKPVARLLCIEKSSKGSNLVNIRTLENQVGDDLYLDLPTSIASTAIYYNDFRDSDNQTWKMINHGKDESGATLASFESVKYPSWYLSHDNKKVIAANKQMIWKLDMGLAPNQQPPSHSPSSSFD